MGDRHRCLTVGCNPKLKNRAAAEQHKEQTGHRIARWPKRSAEGERNREQYMSGRFDDSDGQLDREALSDYEFEKG